MMCRAATIHGESGEEWQARITEELDDLTHHWGMLEYVLDPKKTRKLRRMYRMLARRLHPDLNPSQSPARAELWHRVTAAYEAQELDDRITTTEAVRDERKQWLNQILDHGTP